MSELARRSSPSVPESQELGLAAHRAARPPRPTRAVAESYTAAPRRANAARRQRPSRRRLHPPPPRRAGGRPPPFRRELLPPPPPAVGRSPRLFLYRPRAGARPR